jgi:hypothetical protein
MAERPRIEMQGERNKLTFAVDIESGRRLSFCFDIYASPDLLLDKPLS